MELPLQARDEVLEWSLAFKFSFWLEVPDSEDDEEEKL
jgi:hypothetical protein